jgi:hypothetical protein
MIWRLGEVGGGQIKNPKELGGVCACPRTHSLVGVANVLGGDLPSHLLGGKLALLTANDVDLGVQSDHRLVLGVVLSWEDVHRSVAV